LQNTKVATVLGSVPASFDTMESEGHSDTMESEGPSDTMESEGPSDTMESEGWQKSIAKMAVKRLWHPDKVLRYAGIIKVCRPGTEFTALSFTKISKSRV
jgi:hypothetical protein